MLLESYLSFTTGNSLRYYKCSMNSNDDLPWHEPPKGSIEGVEHPSRFGSSLSWKQAWTWRSLKSWCGKRHPLGNSWQTKREHSLKSVGWLLQSASKAGLACTLYIIRDDLWNMYINVYKAYATSKQRKSSCVPWAKMMIFHLSLGLNPHTFYKFTNVHKVWTSSVDQTGYFSQCALLMLGTFNIHLDVKALYKYM